MVVVLPKLGIAYFPMRKVASTTVKRALKDICTAEDDYQATYGVPMSARQRRLAQGHFKFTVVRDPVSRVLSCYGNRVGHYNDLSRRPIDRVLARLFGLNPTPDADEFCRSLRLYRLLNDRIRRHTRPQYVSLGHDLAYFDGIYPIAELDRLAEDLSRKTGVPINFAHLRTAGPKIHFEDLRPDSQKALLDFTAPDYDLLKDFFTPPALPR